MRTSLASGRFVWMGAFDDINHDVWLPFQRAYSRLDIELFAAIHASDFVRVETAGRWIGDLDSYRQRTGQGFERARTQGDVLTIDFRFIDRLLGDDIAYERGVYRVTVTDSDERTQVFHGRFHSVHRRTAEGWRLLLDHDDDGDGTVGAADFEGARPLDRTDAFDSIR